MESEAYCVNQMVGQHRKVLGSLKGNYGTEKMILKEDKLEGYQGGSSAFVLGIR